MSKHIYVAHPVTGECVVCNYKLYDSLHFFVRFPTTPVNSLYNKAVPKVENLQPIKTIRCEACE